MKSMHNLTSPYNTSFLRRVNAHGTAFHSARFAIVHLSPLEWLLVGGGSRRGLQIFRYLPTPAYRCRPGMPASGHVSENEGQSIAVGKRRHSTRMTGRRNLL